MNLMTTSTQTAICWYPGGRRNKSVEVEWGVRDVYEFSLCRRQKPEDEFEFRLFVYRAEHLGGGFKYVGGYHTIDEAKRGAEAWTDS